MAQVTTGSIVGTISDESGSVVPVAVVTAHNMDTGADTATESDQSGTFTLNFLRAGHYQLSVEAAGFQRLQRGRIFLRHAANARLSLDANGSGSLPVCLLF